MANTTWNPADKSANCVLSNGNLTAKSSVTAPNGTRSADQQTAGKFYWEYTWNTTSSINDCAGISSVSGTLTGGPTTAGPRCVVACSNGNILLNGTTTGSSVGPSVTSGQVLCLAVDCTNSLIWFRVGAAGNWNNSGTANPATGVGGVSIASQLAGIPVYAIVEVGATTGQLTANFGDSTFTGAVPSGFTAGFTAGGSGGGTAQAVSAMVLA